MCIESNIDIIIEIIDFLHKCNYTTNIIKMNTNKNQNVFNKAIKQKYILQTTYA